MIKVEKGNVSIKGNEADVLTELTIVVRQVREFITENSDKEHAEKMIDKVFELSRMSPEDIHKIATNVMGEVIKDILSDDEFMEDFTEFLKSLGDK